MLRRVILLTSLLAAGLLVLACGEDDPKTNDRQGYTACGENIEGKTVYCNPGQYCDNNALNLCEAGCTSAENCLASEACVKTNDQQIGTCVQTTQPDLDTTPDQTPTGICSTANPCPSGQFCFNGICALGCTNDSNCASNQYCDTFSMFCQNKEVPGCTADADCGEGRICKSGLCSLPPVPTQCTPRYDADDGCGEYALCIEDDNEKLACYSFPPCGENLSCPTGLEGAVCNVQADGNKFFPAKGKFCLTGHCLSDANCPSSFNCLTPSGWPIGVCSNGQEMSYCETDAHCATGLKCDSFMNWCTKGTVIPGSCTTDADCDEGEVCNTFMNMCEPDF